LSDGEKTPFTEVTSYEVGLRYIERPWFEGSLAMFHTDLSQDLAFDQTTARNEVTPATQRNGIAAELTARGGEWFTMSASATYTHASFTESDAQYNKGDLLPYVPELVVRSDAAVRAKLARLWDRDLTGRFGWALQSLIGRPLPYSEF